MKKCPPGVICVENFTLFFLIIGIFIIVFLTYANIKQTIKIHNTDNITVESSSSAVNQTSSAVPPPSLSNLYGVLPNYPYNNLPQDVLLNPYAAPYKNERYLVPEVQFIPPNTVPINVSTNIGAVDTAYRQIGILTPLNETSKDNILPLMGRPLYTNRNKWQYYAISNQHNNVKLPISFKGKSALNDYGVDQIYGGDTVYVEGYNDAFRSTVYETDTIKYLPFI